MASWGEVAVSDCKSQERGNDLRAGGVILGPFLVSVHETPRLLSSESQWTVWWPHCSRPPGLIWHHILLYRLKHGIDISGTALHRFNHTSLEGLTLWSLGMLYPALTLSFVGCSIALFLVQLFLPFTCFLLVCRHCIQFYCYADNTTPPQSHSYILFLPFFSKLDSCLEETKAWRSENFFFLHVLSLPLLSTRTLNSWSWHGCLLVLWLSFTKWRNKRVEEQKVCRFVFMKLPLQQTYCHWTTEHHRQSINIPSRNIYIYTSFRPESFNCGWLHWTTKLL